MSRVENSILSLAYEPMQFDKLCSGTRPMRSGHTKEHAVLKRLAAEKRRAGKTDWKAKLRDIRVKRNSVEQIVVHSDAAVRSEAPYSLLLRARARDAAELSAIDIAHLERQRRENVVYEPVYSKGGLHCYGCRAFVHFLHHDYVYSCVPCGEKFARNRMLTRDIFGLSALVTGGRTKLGYQIAVKLLRAGATVVITTRFPDTAVESYRKEPDSERWIHRLYARRLDLCRDADSVSAEVVSLREWITGELGGLDILVNCAAQTIRMMPTDPAVGQEANRYGNPTHLPDELPNSWKLRLTEVQPSEMEEVLRVNLIGPQILCAEFLSTLRKTSKRHPGERGVILNVHAREGIMAVRKGKGHIHTNVAKAGLAMLTNCLAQTEKRLSVHGCDPGFISVNEYYSSESPWPVAPPLDEVDGAARILYPLFTQLKSCGKTRRHFDELII